MRFLVIFLLVFCFLNFEVKAQDKQISSLHVDAPFLFNDASVGESITLLGDYRTQWTSLEGAPDATKIKLSVPLAPFSYFGGFGFDDYSIGFTERSSLHLFLGRYLLDKKKSKLTLAVNGNMNFNSIDGSKINTPGGVYTDNNIIDHKDGLLSELRQQGRSFDVGLSLYGEYKTWNYGLSVNNLMSNDVLSSDGEYDFGKNNKNIVLILMNYLEINNNFEFNPFITLHSDSRIIQTNVGADLKYKDIIEVGLGMRGYSSNSLDAIFTKAGINYKKMSLFYGYDVGLNSLADFHNNSHEIMVIYKTDANLFKVKKIYPESHPRY